MTIRPSNAVNQHHRFRHQHQRTPTRHGPPPILLKIITGHGRILPVAIKHNRRFIPTAHTNRPRLLTPNRQPRHRVTHTANRKLQRLTRRRRINQPNRRRLSKTTLTISNPLRHHRRVQFTLRLVRHRQDVTTRRNLKITACRITRIRIIRQIMTPSTQGRLFSRNTLTNLPHTHRRSNQRRIGPHHRHNIRRSKRNLRNISSVRSQHRSAAATPLTLTTYDHLPQNYQNPAKGVVIITKS